MPVSSSVRVSALALPAVRGGEQLLLPAGTFDAPRGALEGTGPWHLGDVRGAALERLAQARRRDIPIDYEHQTLLARTNGHPAPAAGWIRPADIRWDPSAGLVATAVHWTDKAAAMIAAGEYRYLSPVFTYFQGGEVRDLLHVALTNTPALDTLPEVALAAASLPSTFEDPPMSDFRGRVARLLSPDAPDAPELTDEQIDAQLDAVQAALSAAGHTGGLAAYIAQSAAQVAALSAASAGAVPATVVAALQAELAGLKAGLAQDRKAALLAACVADGRLAVGSALHTHASGLELAQLEQLAGALTPVAALSGPQTAGYVPPESAGNAEDGGPFTAALAAEFGDEDTYRAYVRGMKTGTIKIFKGDSQ